MNAHDLPTGDAQPLSATGENIRLRFETAWKSGQPPRLEDYLGEAPESERKGMLSELLALELRYRSRSGQEPLPEEYLARFPDHAELIPSLFRIAFPPSPVTQGEPKTLPHGRVLRTVSEAGRGTPPPPEPVAAEVSTLTPPPSAPPTEAVLEAYAFLAPPREPEEIGWLGSYRVLKLLGSGGMGMVFQAEDVALQRLVALKVMKPALAADLGARTRFLREARAAAALNNDYIVTIYQVGLDGDVPFLAMEFLEGEPLDRRLEREGKLALADVVRIGREIAEGLSAAHEHGLIHRDIKPGNIWLEARNDRMNAVPTNFRVKILDFGLARAAADDVHLTQSGMIVGTPAYMAPEQARAEKVDARSDLFSLGCVLYRMSTGKAPFRGGHLLAAMSALALDQPPSPQEVNPDVPSALSDLVMRLLAKKPADRPPSARAVVEALEAIERAEAAGASGPLPHAGARPRQTDSLRSVSIPLPPDEQAAAGKASPAHHSGVWEPVGSATQPGGEAYLSQLRLLLEELACGLGRFEHVIQDRLAPEGIQIDREVYLGTPGAFADIRIAVPGQLPYFVEIKYGYSGRRLVQALRRKYGTDTPALANASKLVLVVDSDQRADWPHLESEVAQVLRPSLRLEVWNEKRLIALLRERFGVNINSITEADLLDVRQAIDRAKGFHAFGGETSANYEHDPLKAELLWHFGFWRLRQLRDAYGLTPREILPPGLYRGVVVLTADFCSFASYVRDTRDDEVIRDSLTSFYSKARYQILNNGGMVYQFIEDEVVALFGIPDQRPQYLLHALETAKALLGIGVSVSNHWQRHIDRVQKSAGLHIGLAVGEVQVVSLRPFSRTHMGILGAPFTVAARLMAKAGPSEIAVSNSFYQGLPEEAKSAFEETETVEARHVGHIKAWKLGEQWAAKKAGDTE